MDKTLVRGAMLIALTVVLQSLRLFIPLPPMASMFFIGTLVNMMLAVTVRLAGLKPALLAVVLLPFFAYLQGQLPIPLLIPVVIGGNAVFVLICHWLYDGLAADGNRYLRHIAGTVNYKTHRKFLIWGHCYGYKSGTFGHYCRKHCRC